jgi:transcriptional regulator with XRE-family HTH domain
MDLLAILGRNVRAWRKRRGMSQEDLAAEAGMKRSYVSDMERGTRNPTIKALARLALALTVDPEELVRAAPAAPLSRDTPPAP